MVLEIEVQGARQIAGRDPSALLIFLDPPTRPSRSGASAGGATPTSWCRPGWPRPTEEAMPPSELGALRVVNDDLDRAVDEVLDLIDAARHDRRHGAPAPTAW